MLLYPAMEAKTAVAQKLHLFMFSLLSGIFKVCTERQLGALAAPLKISDDYALSCPYFAVAYWSSRTHHLRQDYSQE